ncbi:MAG TPA: acyl carrier protein [Planctomycetaceae bacterium]|nr:acyl carrier protein [Planctomycetaceae bacterium]
MNEEQIKQVILEILARIAPDEDLSDLQDEVPFRDQLDLDSMDFLDIVMELRKLFRIQIPEEDYEQLASMESTVKYLAPLLKNVESPA